MAPVVFLDTHVIVWLYAFGGAALPATSAALVERSNDIRISPMARLELQYLFEIDRVAERPLNAIDTLAGALGMTICDAPFGAVIRQAELQCWTRDPFDRLIVAQADLFEAFLITKDEGIHANYSHAVWL